MKTFDEWWAVVEKNLIADGKYDELTLAALEVVANGAWAACEQQFRTLWKPIETAPKYGPFLVYGGTFRSKLYSDSENLQAVKVSSRAVDLYFFNVSDFAFYIADTDCHELWVVNPTHWMPLPQPPK